MGLWRGPPSRLPCNSELHAQRPECVCAPRPVSRPVLHVGSATQESPAWGPGGPRLLGPQPPFSLWVAAAAPAPWLRRPGLPLLTSRKKEEPARVVLLCSQAALWRCSSVLQSSPPTECSGGAVSIADIALNSLGSPTERPGTPPRPPANTSLFPVSGPACLDVAWPWSHGGCDLLCLVSVTHRHALQVHPGRVVSGLPSSLSLSDTPLGAGVDFTCPVCPWALSVRVLAARGVGA